MLIPEPVPTRIGIFDSGIGGVLTAGKLARISGLELSCIADLAFYPYGDLSVGLVRDRALALSQHLLSKDIDSLVVACNTAEVAAIDVLRNYSSAPVLSTIEVTARSAAQLTQSGVVGVLGTTVTIQSRAYEHALADIDSQLDVWPIACPEFAFILFDEDRRARSVVLRLKRELAPAVARGLDTLVLGCTAYSLLTEHLEHVFGSSVTIVDSATELARAVGAQFSQGPGQLSGSGIDLTMTARSTAFESQALAVLGTSRKDCGWVQRSDAYLGTHFVLEVPGQLRPQSYNFDID